MEEVVEDVGKLVVNPGLRICVLKRESKSVLVEGEKGRKGGKERTLILDSPMHLNPLQLLNTRIIPQNPPSELFQNCRRMRNSRSARDENDRVMTSKVMADAVGAVEEDGGGRV